MLEMFHVYTAVFKLVIISWCSVLQFVVLHCWAWSWYSSGGKSSSSINSSCSRLL